MKDITRLIFTAVLFSIILLGPIVPITEASKFNVASEPPKRLVLRGVGEPKLGDNGYEIYLTEAFYPIGFSKSGKFAYYVEPADEACGCYFAKLVIQDLRTDKILWKHEYESEPTDAIEGKETPLPTIKEHWKKNKAKFSQALAKYGIKPQDQFTLAESIKYRRDVFKPKLDLKIDKEDVYSVDGKLNLMMVSEKRGSKSIYQRKYRANDYSGFRTAEISGVLKSPYGSRAAVVLVEVIRGYEGPPNITRVKIVGTDLTSRFRK